MKNQNERLRLWRDECQQSLGVAAHNLQISHTALENAKQAFSSVTYWFPEEQMATVEEIERILNLQSAEIFRLLGELDRVRRLLDQLI